MTALLALVPLSIFRSNSKFDENSEPSSFKYTRPITTIFCTRHDSDTVVTCARYRCDRPCIFYTRVFWIFIEFEFDRNMLSGTSFNVSSEHQELSVTLTAFPFLCIKQSQYWIYKVGVPCFMFWVILSGWAASVAVLVIWSIDLDNKIAWNLNDPFIIVPPMRQHHQLTRWFRRTEKTMVDLISFGKTEVMKAPTKPNKTQNVI